MVGKTIQRGWENFFRVDKNSGFQKKGGHQKIFGMNRQKSRGGGKFKVRPGRQTP